MAMDCERTQGQRELIMKRIGLIALAIGLAGCSGFRHHSLPVVQPEQVQVTAPDKLTVRFKWKVVSGRSIFPDQVNQAEKLHDGTFKQELIRSGCCVIAARGQEPDIEIEAIINPERNIESPVIGLLRVPAQITFAIIPAWDNVYYDHTFTVKTKSGINRSYSSSDGMTTVQWLPMAIPFIFGKDPYSTELDTVANAQRYFIYRMKKDGLLSLASRGEGHVE